MLKSVIAIMTMLGSTSALGCTDEIVRAKAIELVKQAYNNDIVKLVDLKLSAYHYNTDEGPVFSVYGVVVADFTIVTETNRVTQVITSDVNKDCSLDDNWIALAVEPVNLGKN